MSMQQVMLEVCALQVHALQVYGQAQAQRLPGMRPLSSRVPQGTSRLQTQEIILYQIKIIARSLSLKEHTRNWRWTGITGFCMRGSSARRSGYSGTWLGKS